VIARGSRRNGQPVHVEGDLCSSLKRLALDGREFNEEWIQKLLYSNPTILPIHEIEPSFSPLISIGREISTPAGYLDNLYVSPDGYLTIVETKLWRNPEARREVVGQIIDYAKELSRWTFTDLDKSVVSFNRLYNGSEEGLLEAVRKSNGLEASEEADFIDNVSRNLKRGRFLLLIVGDGIRESVEDMVEYLSQSPQLHFTLALVELQVFKLGEVDSLIVIPHVVTRTREITRAVVRIEGGHSSDLKVNIETDIGLESETSKAGTMSRLTITAEDFFDQLLSKTSSQTVEFARHIIKDCQERGYSIEWNSGSFGVKVFDPRGSGQKIGLFTVDKNGQVYLAYSKDRLTRLGIPVELSYALAIETAEMLPNIYQNPETKYSWNKYSTLSDLRPVYDRFMARVKRYVDDITLAGS
jgi:hypothetical protein